MRSNGVTVDALKTLLSVSAEFDQSVGFNNKLIKDEKTFNVNLKKDCLTRRSSLEDQSLALTRKIADLKTKKLQAKTDPEKEEIQNEVDELTIVQAAVKEQLTQTNDKLKALSAGDEKFEALSLPCRLQLTWNGILGQSLECLMRRNMWQRSALVYKIESLRREGGLKQKYL